MKLNSNIIFSLEDNEVVNYYNEDLVSDLENNYSFQNYSTFSDGLEYILECIEKGDIPKLWLIDINLEEENGFDFIDSVMTKLNSENLPDIYMLTTSLHKSDEKSFTERDSIKGYIGKPLTLKKLNSCLN